MDLKKIFTNDKAVSPVIGVVLMVAITVILAAAIGSSVFGQGPSESAPQANIDIIVVDQDTVKFEHLGGDTIIFDPASTKIMLADSTGSYALDTEQFNSDGDNTTDDDITFDVGMTKTLDLTTEYGNTSAAITETAGEFATIKIVDVQTSQLIADKELRF